MIMIISNSHESAIFNSIENFLDNVIHVKKALIKLT